MAMYWIIDGQRMTNEEYEELKRQKQLEKQQVQEESARLSRQLGAAYAALKEHLRRNPDTSQKITDERALEQQIYQNLRCNLQRADKAPRCVAVKEDGTVCGSPKMKNHIYCYAHIQMKKARAEKFVLPALEDANAILMAVMRVQKALIDDEISEKKAGLLLYSIQIAAASIGKTTFGQAKDEDMVTEVRDEEAGLREYEQEMERVQRIAEIQRGRNLPLMNTEHTEHTDQESGEQGIPRMNAEDRGSEPERLPLMNSEDTDQAGVGKMLPQSAGAMWEGFAS
jgi:hypothetical protein